MKTRIALAASIVALFATTADAGQAARSTDHRIIRLNDSAESLIKARLKDPDSAKFDAVFVRNSSGVPMICGTVTSKNGFGGYGDPIPFLSAGTAEFTFMRGDVDDWPQLWNHLCAR